MATQVIGEDLKLVVAQQAQMEKGGDAWATPVENDRLGVEYRRWRNTLQNRDQENEGE
eukprot:CAMPEP_0196593574 /NCGR_PEP_ID=MMETSP1081-20130531/76007_1 /TAXON_ID=36882 /ORGANISM="Pyramimonas amylifera, Strain CCMP720" /LENGTH=57 /DNA_ID=CAMNT_0041917593 /DNA_START=273 /DNA_END=446 /DNA_ORIENTATION=-